MDDQEITRERINAEKEEWNTLNTLKNSVKCLDTSSQDPRGKQVTSENIHTRYDIKLRLFTFTPSSFAINVSFNLTLAKLLFFTTN